MSQHTPGPWTAKQAQLPVDGEYDWCIAAPLDGVKRVIAETFGRASEHDRPNAEANARLIAAAPDLLEALERLAVACSRYDEEPDAMLKQAEYASAKAGAYAAIAKAKGETP